MGPMLLCSCLGPKGAEGRGRVIDSAIGKYHTQPWTFILFLLPQFLGVTVHGSRHQNASEQEGHLILHRGAQKPKKEEERTYLGPLHKLGAKMRLAFRSILFIPLFIDYRCPGTDGPRGLAQTGRTGGFYHFQNNTVFLQHACLCGSHSHGLKGFQTLIFNLVAKLEPIMLGATAIYEGKVPEEQEWALGRKRVI